MDIAHRLAALRAQSPGEIVKSANRYLPPAVTLVLVAVVAYLAAQLTWRLVPTPADAAPLPPIATPGGPGSAGGGAIDASRIVNRHPFGIANPQEPKIDTRVTTAPVTTQPLKLTGVVLSELVPEVDESFAMISTSNRESNQYVVGDSVQGVNGVRVVEIFEREVLLNVNGRAEKLTFCANANETRGECRQVTAAAARVSMPMTQPPPISVQQPRQTSGEDVRQLIQGNAQRLANIVVPTLYSQDGVTGFTVRPGADRETFESLGFKHNDVVTNINGAPLTSPQDGIRLMEQLANVNTTTVTVLRDGTQQSITLDTTRLRSILENRE